MAKEKAMPPEKLSHAIGGGARVWSVEPQEMGGLASMGDDGDARRKGWNA